MKNKKVRGKKNTKFMQKVNSKKMIKNHRKLKKKGESIKKNKRRTRKRTKQSKKKQNKKKSKTKKIQRENRNCNAAKDEKKANNWKKQAKSIQKIMRNVDGKVQSTNEGVFLNASILLSVLTNNGTKSCEGTEDSLNAYKLLNNCTNSVLDVCSHNIDISNAANCESINDDFLACDDKCDCAHEASFEDECNFVDKFQEAKTLRSNCVFDKYRTCMRTVKAISSIISGCIESIAAPEATTAATEPTTQEPPTNTVESSSVRVEEGEVIVQQNSFNKDTQELTMMVPAHGDRVAATIIVGDKKMATVFPQYCIVTDPPANFTVGDGTSDDAEIDTEKVYSVDEDAGEMSEEEVASLSETIRTACANKAIRKANKLNVDETTFNRRNFKSSTIRTTRRKRQSNCNNPQVSKVNITLTVN